MKALLSDLPPMLVPCLTYGVIIRGGGQSRSGPRWRGEDYFVSFCSDLKVNRSILDDWESTEKHKEES